MLRVRRVTTETASRRRFLHDRSGNVAITFGLALLPAILVAGAAIDYSRTVTQWSNLQQATDATALTVAHAYLSKSSSAAGLTTFAQSYINGLMYGAKLDGPPVLKQSNTVVCINSTFAVSTAIMKIVNITSLNVTSNACSQVGQTYEVALTVDNSFSMNETDSGGTTKISSLQSAAKTLVDILVPSGQTTPQVGVSIVPFNSLVNVGASNANASFMDTSGSSSIHWQNFLRPGGGSYKPTTKFDLYNGMNTSWGGCVEELPPPYATTDTDPNTASDAKFVPYLAPDEADGNKNGSYTIYSGSGTTPYPIYQQNQIFINSYLKDSGSSTNSLGSCSTSGKNTVYGTADNGTSNVLPSAGMTMVCKYGGGSTTPSPSVASLGSGISTGPNFECSTQAVQPLTTDRNALYTKINALAPGGSTNLASGFMWGWRSISPTINAFPVSSSLTIGQQSAKSYTYGPPANQKVVILMTDGMNSWATPRLNNYYYYNSFGSYYEGFGYLANGRISSYLAKNLVSGETCSGASLTADNARCALDQVTMEACNNAKAKGIVVYTIGFSVPSDPIDTIGQQVLSQCASSTAKYFLATDSASIQLAFQQIASSILSLRLTQ